MKTIEELEAKLETVTRERDEARAEVERLMHQLADQTNETTRVRLEAKREIEALTDERDELLVRVAEQDAELRATRESYNEARAECERMKTFAAQNFSQMIRQEAEQMREYGLSYEGVRKVLREHDDGEISFGKLMDLIRAAARAMAEDNQRARVRELETQLRIERENVAELEERLVLCQRTNDRMREQLGHKPPPWGMNK